MKIFYASAGQGRRDGMGGPWCAEVTEEDRRETRPPRKHKNVPVPRHGDGKKERKKFQKRQNFKIFKVFKIILKNKVIKLMDILKDHYQKRHALNSLNFL